MPFPAITAVPGYRWSKMPRPGRVKKRYWDPLVVTHLKCKSVFDKPQIKSWDRIALREFQQSLKCVIALLKTMGFY